MCRKENLNKMGKHVDEYKENIILIENLLKNYTAEDKIYLLAENHRLKKKIKNIEIVIKRSFNSIGEAQDEIYKYCKKYFCELKKELIDFLIILQWNNFGALQTKLQNLKIEKCAYFK